MLYLTLFDHPLTLFLGWYESCCVDGHITNAYHVYRYVSIVDCWVHEVRRNWQSVEYCKREWEDKILWVRTTYVCIHTWNLQHRPAKFNTESNTVTETKRFPFIVTRLYSKYTGEWSKTTEVAHQTHKNKTKLNVYYTISP